MAVFHRLLGLGIVLALLALAVWGLLLRTARREKAPVSYWGLQHWTENLLVVQVVAGLILLAVGRRVVGGSLIWLHYLYGSLFPLIALIGGRLAGLRRKEGKGREYVGLAWGAFIAWGLTMRGLMTGCGDTLALDVLRACLFG